MNRKQQIEQRLAEIKGILAGEGQCDVNALETEVRSLKAELVEIDAKEKRRQIAEDIQTGEVETRQIEKPTAEKTGPSEAEKRGQALKEKRSVTIASTGVILPNPQATDIKPTFNQVSSLIDRVSTKYLPGGESFKQPYSTGYGEGGYTTEGGNPTEADPTFGYALISKTKITAYAEDSEELVKLPAVNYDAEVQKGIRIAIRKKLNREMLTGDGEAGHFVGIFDNGATAIDANTDKEIAEIDETTLDEIICDFGGDEEIEDIAVLILNKKDLKAFRILRGDDGKKIYEVKSTGNTGTIDGIPYIISSKCNALSNSETSSGAYCMAYGPLSNYMVAVFSDIDIQRSTDYKFKEGMIAHRGVVFSGGNVIAKNGFLRIKKA